MIQVTITHLSGSRRNAVETFGTLPLKLGRADACAVRFDPEQDIKVSAEHAELRADGQGGVEIADLGSTNGVLVNGVRVEGSAAVPNLAVIEVGADGPRLKLTYERGAHGISFSKLRRPAADEADGHQRTLRTTDETPAYSPEDLEPPRAAPPEKPGPATGAIIALTVLLVAAVIVALLLLRG